MNKSWLIGALSGAVFTLFTLPTHAALIGVLPATPGETDYQAYYDPDADLTWLANANAGADTRWDDGFSTTDGRMTWENAIIWAATLNIDGVENWRLPSSRNSDGSGPCDSSFNTVNCSDSEMGNLYYNVLGNTSGSGGFTNPGPFSNVQSFRYWSSTEYAPDPPGDWWHFQFNAGYQFSFSEVIDGHGWAVQSGNVGAAVVPVPAAVWLFGSGLLGLIGVSRQRRRC